MRQRWIDLLYMHWRYPREVVQELLPSGLEVDCFDGSAWVGLIPFSMRDVGLARGPSVPYFGAFSEVNVRTYVRVGSQRGVWFFSLDVDRLLPAAVARVTYKLPYCWGDTTHERTGSKLYTSITRRWPEKVQHSEISATIGEPIVGDDLDVFLSARWGLFSSSRRGLRYAPVDHEPWPLHEAQLDCLDDSLVKAAGLPEPSGEPLVRFSPGVSVRIGMPRRV